MDVFFIILGCLFLIFMFEEVGAIGAIILVIWFCNTVDDEVSKVPEVKGTSTGIMMELRDAPEINLEELCTSKEGVWLRDLNECI